MKKAHRYLTLAEIGYTEEQIELIFAQLGKDKPTAWYDTTIIWSMDTDGKRYVFVQVGDPEIALTIEHTTLMKTMEDFRKAFRDDEGEELPTNNIIDKLALFDVQRSLKWPLMAYYQSKIADLARF
ncbi:hypothetical protein D3C81_351700 [compost metagenome]